jgi:hypothetical protein
MTYCLFSIDRTIRRPIKIAINKSATPRMDNNRQKLSTSSYYGDDIS